MSDLIRKRSATERLIIVKTLLEFVLQDIPTAEKKGKWIPVTNGRGGHECDQCHEYAPSWQTGEERLTNYCPNCGARMEESE